MEARIGKGIVSQGIPIIVEDMQFSGFMKFKIKLQIPFPHVSDLRFRTGMDLANGCVDRESRYLFPRETNL